MTKLPLAKSKSVSTEQLNKLDLKVQLSYLHPHHLIFDYLPNSCIRFIIPLIFLQVQRNGNNILNVDENRMDKYALNGLRGLLSFWVMSHHAWSLSPHATATNKGVIFLYGGAAMPFFFLLSGFSLTLKYGVVKWNTCSADIGDVNENIYNKTQRRFDYWTFYRNRLIRIFPVYFIGIVLSLILWKFRYMCKYNIYV